MRKLLIIILALFFIAGCSSNTVEQELIEPTPIAEPATEPIEEVKENVVTGSVVKEKLRTIILDEEFELEGGQATYFYFTTRRGEYYKIVVQMLDSGRYYNFALMTKEECDKYKNSVAYNTIVQEMNKQNSYYYSETQETEARNYCMAFQHNDDMNVIVKKRVKVESCNYLC